MLCSIPGEEIGIDNIDKAVESMLQEELNGQEIANAVNTARTIARYEKEQLQLKYIEMVVKVRRDFNKTLQKEKRKLTLRKSEAIEEPNTLLKQGSIVLTANN